MVTFFKDKKNMPVAIDIFLDRPVYEKFRTYIARNGLDESSAVIQVLERGMANYWVQEFKSLKQNYPFIEELYKEYKKDNEVLKALARQNEQLQKLLKEKPTRENSNPSKA